MITNWTIYMCIHLLTTVIAWFCVSVFLITVKHVLTIPGIMSISTSRTLSRRGVSAQSALSWVLDKTNMHSRAAILETLIIQKSFILVKIKISLTSKVTKIYIIYLYYSQISNFKIIYLNYSTNSNKLFIIVEINYNLVCERLRTHLQLFQVLSLQPYYFVWASSVWPLLRKCFIYFNSVLLPCSTWFIHICITTLVQYTSVLLRAVSEVRFSTPVYQMT